MYQKLGRSFLNFVKALLGIAFMFIVSIAILVIGVRLIQVVLIPAAQEFLTNVAVIVGIAEVIIAIAIGAEAFVGVSSFLWKGATGTITT